METVKVSKIAEYNYRLGSRCCLLEKHGLSPYINSEEEICAFLENSAKNKESVEFCKNQSRCAGFWREFEKGQTPFNEKDPIRLAKEEDRFYVLEGKHRCCLAMRAGVETIEAEAVKLEDSGFRVLPEVGKAGQYTFTASFGKDAQTGEIAVLWIAPTKGEPITKFLFRPIPLNIPFIDGHEEKTVLSGVSYTIDYKTECEAPAWKKIVTATVSIAPEHRNTRIWLFTIPAKQIKSDAALISIGKTYFRQGKWRKEHLRQAFRTY